MEEIKDVPNAMIDKRPVKEVMHQAMQYLETDGLNTITIVTNEMLVEIDRDKTVKKAIESFDIVLAGDKILKEQNNYINHQLFPKMFIQYLHKSARNVFLLAETEAELDCFKEFLKDNYNKITIVGTATVLKDGEKDESIANAINGLDVECLLSILGTPLQETFVMTHKAIIHGSLWIGIGKNFELYKRTKKNKNPIKRFVEKYITKS